MKRKQKYIVGKPQVTADEIKEVVKVVKSGRWVAGPQTVEFAEMFKKDRDCKFAIPVSSGTAALHLAINSLDIGSGDEVITTPFTYPATSHVIEYVGAKPVFVDIERDTYNIDPEAVARAVTKKTKVIMPVDIAGHPCDLEEIMLISKKHGLYVIEDAAHTAEAKYKKRKIGSIADFTCFSFDVTKNVAGGMGGMITTNNPKYAKTIGLRAHFGIPRVNFYEPYNTVYPGFKYDMTEFCAAIAKHQLARVYKNLSLREKYWGMYSQSFADIPELTILKEKDNILHSRHLYMVLLDLEALKCTREDFLKELANLGVEARIRFSAIHLHDYYKQKYGYKPGDFPVAEYVSERVFCLPLSPVLGEDDIRYIIHSVKKILEKFKK